MKLKLTHSDPFPLNDDPVQERHGKHCDEKDDRAAEHLETAHICHC